ncbi:MAG: class I SAM-dependent methyltransferase [Deltaproteobacteria bacterium]|nr:class I SAM-dependent methyltransferase [Deltaproteobacteria bacterium]
MSERLDTKGYYDRFSQGYDRPRDRGYHWMIDTLQSEMLLPLAEGKDVLELGCGTGLIMDRLKGRCASLTGVDLSGGMLSGAMRRGHQVGQARVEALPFADESFDLVFSFKVLAHVERIEETLAEAARVLRPGGYLVADFYNPLSLRGLIKMVKPASPVAPGTTDRHVFTRFDSPEDVRGYLPEDLKVVGFEGVRVLTPWAGLLKVPGVTGVMTRLERWAGRNPVTWRFAGFLLVTARKDVL